MSKILSFLFPSARRALDLDQQAKTLLPAPSSRSLYAPTEDQALSLSAVFRAIEIISNSIIQLPLTVERSGQKLPDSQVPSIIKTPWLGHTRSEFLEYITLSLVLNGNAFYRIERSDQGAVVNLVPLPPSHVAVETTTSGEDFYTYNGKKYNSYEMKHIHVKRLPGRSRGMGPIQAARTEISGHVKTATYGARYFDEYALPSGVLSSDQALSTEDSQQAKKAWYASEDKAGIKVLGKGLKFEPLDISPKDAQWIEAQQFGVVQIARLFGVPSSLMLAALDGNSQTYSNVEQDWIGYTRFTLMGYVRKIEDSLTELVPGTQKVRFNLEGLLRSDTKTRYASYEIAIKNKFMTVDEARALEGMDPLTSEQIDQFRTLENLRSSNGL